MTDYFGSAKKGIEWLSKVEPNTIIEIEKVRGKRSNQQNKIYWFYLGIIESETGNNAEELHELFKRKFLKPIISKIKINGKIIEYKRPGSTTELNKIQFGEYLEKINALTGIPIPQYEPNQ